jgi:hypothetical protein
MSTYERSIVSLIEPDYKGKLKIDEIFIEDSESKEAQDKTQNVRPNPFKTSSRLGVLVPMIVINQLRPADDEILSFDLSFNGKIPTVNLSIHDTDNKLSLSAPLDGDVISVYLRPPDVTNQKPIRLDFNITTIGCSVESQNYYFSGSLKIPEFFKEKCKSFSQNTSVEHLQDICEDSGLGFATNEETVDDTMTRICAYDTYETFVNDVVFSAYKDDDSFFDWYIDPYYYLCFVNVNKQFSLEDKVEEINITSSFPLSGMAGQEDTEESINGSLVLTNQTSMAGKNVFIEKYTVLNKAGNVWLSNGYKRYAQWMNIGETEITYEKAFADPLTTPGAETDFILLKGRRSDGDFYSTMSKYKWMGKQAPVSEQGNVHDNYCYTRVLNHQNLEEIDKTLLEVELPGMNFYLYKYMRIPVNIYQSNNPKNAELMKGRNDAIGESNKNPDTFKDSGVGKISNYEQQDVPDEEGTPNNRDQIKNEFLSVYYIIKSIEYKYRPGGQVNTRLILSRREWPIPAPNKDL